MSSGSWTDLRRLSLGTEVAGFRLERELGRGRRAVVYEATQVSLDRRVALKLLPAGDAGTNLARSLEWPEHRHVVRLYAAGSWEGGRFVAMRLVQGTSLDRIADADQLDAAHALELLADVASALDAAHDAGVVHGAVTARNVLVDQDGQALLSDFGLGGGESTVAADRRAFAALLQSLLDEFPSGLPDPVSCSASELVRVVRADLPMLAHPPTRARWRRKVAGACIVGLAAAVVIVVLLGRDSERLEPIPSPVSGAAALGSALEPGGISSVDCSGQPPSGGSQVCTLVQTGLAGRAIVAPQAGTIRRWVVRGAKGKIALQVVRRVGNRYVAPARTPYAPIPDTGLHALPASLPVLAGDRIGVQLTPGAAIGVRRGVAGATTARWLGQLTLTARPVELGAGTGFDPRSSFGPSTCRVRRRRWRVSYAEPPLRKPLPGLSWARISSTSRAARSGVSRS